MNTTIRYWLSSAAGWVTPPIAVHAQGVAPAVGKKIFLTGQTPSRDGYYMVLSVERNEKSVDVVVESAKKKEASA